MSMFKPLPTDKPLPVVNLTLEGRPIRARAGENLALTLLEGGLRHTRFTLVSASPRAPLCLMGVCFECLVEVDGRPNVQACMLEAREGMSVRLQHGARRAGDGHDT
jgi:D-hydroxyproline dehydrogenase subunit gamma